MNPVPESAAKLQRDSAARLRAIPSVDELLLHPRLAALAEKSGRALVTQSVRQVLADFRARLKTEPPRSQQVPARKIAARDLFFANSSRRNENRILHAAIPNS
jgi:hypothetical protein